MSTALDATTCTWCDRELDDEESESPSLGESGEIICDACYDENYRDYCGRCNEKVDKSDLDTSTGQLIGIWNTAPASDGELAPGYYRVKRRPFYVDWMIGGHFYSYALEFALPLDDWGKRQSEEAIYASGPLCSDCRAHLATTQPGNDAPHPAQEGRSDG